MFGSSLSLTPFATTNNGLNIRSEVGSIAVDLVHLLLLQPGEDPMHPDLGAAPPLFANPSTTDFSVDYYRYLINQQIDQYLIGKIAQYRTEVTFSQSRLAILVEFIAAGAPSRHLLSLGYYVYPDKIGDFDVSLNGMLLQ